MILEIVNELRLSFGQIDDQRSDVNKLYKVEDILFIEIISVICAVDTWKNLETYAKAKEEFLRIFLELPVVNTWQILFNQKHRCIGQYILTKYPTLLSRIEPL